MRNFKDLKVWHKAHRFVIDVYQQSRSFPAEERFGLTAHLR
jgi:four helix bundle protein